jgi:metal-responsive CopG/Arc/MetJ family transcriptional regulator
LDGDSAKKLDALAKAKNINRAEALRDAVKEYLAIYRVPEEPTVGRLYHHVQDVEKRLADLEKLLMKKGVDAGRS